MATNNLEPLIYYITNKGGKDVEVDTDHPHPQIHFTYRGVRRFVVTGATPSDWREFENSKRNINRVFTDIDVMTPDYKLQPEEEEQERPRQELTLETFGERVQFAREQQGLSRERLADLSSVPKHLIFEYEVSKQPEADLQASLKLSTALGLSMKYLTGDNLEELAPMSVLGRRIQEKRREKNLTIGQLALDTGIPVQQLVNLETEKYPDFHRLDEVAKALETTPEILKGEAEPFGVFSDIKTPTDLGAMIKYLRLKQGLTQVEVASKLGPGPTGGKIRATDISKIERGVGLRIVKAQARKLAYALDYPEETLTQIIANIEKPPVGRPAGRKKVEVAPITTASSILQKAILEEGEKTRAMLTQQHEEVLEAIAGVTQELRGMASGNVAATLHGLIDNLFKR